VGENIEFCNLHIVFVMDLLQGAVELDGMMDLGEVEFLVRGFPTYLESGLEMFFKLTSVESFDTSRPTRQWGSITCLRFLNQVTGFAGTGSRTLKMDFTSLGNLEAMANVNEIQHRLYGMKQVIQEISRSKTSLQELELVIQKDSVASEVL